MHYSCYKRPLFLLLICYMLALVLFYRPAPSAQDVSHFITKDSVALQARVADFAIVKPKAAAAVLRVTAINGQKVSGRVYARFKDFIPQWHQTLTVRGKLKTPYAVALPGNFNWRSYLAGKHIFAECTVSEVESVRPAPLFFRTIAVLRNHILQTLEQNFPGAGAGIAGGIMLGERGQTDPALYTAFQDSGAIHLLVASGGNVAFVTLLVFLFCSLCGVPRRYAAGLALVVAGLYTLVAGADAPLTRAYFMTVCATAGYFLRRNSGVFQGLLVSCCVILVFHPAALFETGFQMSFLATLAIIVCLSHYQIPYHWPRWVRFFGQILLATLSTQLVLLPIFANVFYKVSLAGLLANMLLVPLASALMGLGFAFYLFSVLGLGFVLKSVLAAGLWCFEFLVQFFAGLPFAAVSASAWSPGWIVCYYVCIFLLFHWPQKEFIRRVYKPLCALVVLVLAVQYIFSQAPHVWLMNEWGHNAVLYRAPDGTRLLLGAGIDGDKLSRAVLASGSNTIEAVLISEDVPRQLKEIEKLKKHISVRQVILPFADTWPGEELSFGQTHIQTQWGLLLNREHQLWRNRGYSGGRDSVSYQVCYKKKCFTAAANGRFIVQGTDITENERNSTRILQIQ